MKNNSSGAISWSIRILQKHLRDDKERITDMATLTAEQRYQKFLREKPNIIRHVPLRYIASYLGITQRHLSRLRQSDRGVARATGCCALHRRAFPNHSCHAQGVSSIHRWLGRVYIGTSILVASAGLVMIWTRGGVGDQGQKIGISVQALYIIVFAWLACTSAKSKKFDTHRKWSLRREKVISSCFTMKCLTFQL